MKFCKSNRIFQKNGINLQSRIALAALALASLSMGKMIVIAGFSDFSKEFSNVSLMAKQLLISIASLSGIPVALLTGKWVTFISKKKLALIACFTFAAGGIGPIFTSDFTIMFVMRCIMGFGMAMASTLEVSLIVEHFAGDRRDALLGYASATKSLFGVLFSFLGGVLIINSWRDAYWLHAIGILVILIVLLFLPDTALKTEKKISASNGKQKIKIGGITYYYSIAAILMFILFSVHGNNISIFFAEYHVGTQAQAGIASALFTVGGFFSGMFFSVIFKKLREQTMVVGYLMAGISLLLFGISSSCISIYLESFIFGVGFYLIITHQTILVTTSASTSSYTLAAAIYLSAINLGQVISPIALNGLEGLLGNGSTRNKYVFAGAGLVAMGVIALMRVMVQRKTVTLKRPCETDG